MKHYISRNQLLGKACMAMIGVCAALSTSLCRAETGSFSSDDAFYHQLLKLPDAHGYQPTRSFSIIVDTAHDNQLVADDDPNLRFNLMWIHQYEPGYRMNRGRSAFGEVMRSVFKSAYKAYRDYNAQSMSAMPDENGNIYAKSNAENFVDAMDYNFKVTDGEVRLKIQYNY